MCRWLRSTGSSFTARHGFSSRIVQEKDQIEIMKDEIRKMKKIIKKGIVVTNEKFGDEKTKDHRIPNVCQAMDIPYINLHTFLDTLLE